MLLYGAKHWQTHVPTWPLHLYSFLGQANISILYTWAETCSTSTTFYLFSWGTNISWVWGMSGQQGGWSLGAVLVHPADRAGNFVKLNWPGCLGIYHRPIVHYKLVRERTCMKLPACFPAISGMQTLPKLSHALQACRFRWPEFPAASTRRVSRKSEGIWMFFFCSVCVLLLDALYLCTVA